MLSSSLSCAPSISSVACSYNGEAEIHQEADKKSIQQTSRDIEKEKAHYNILTINALDEYHKATTQGKKERNKRYFE